MTFISIEKTLLEYYLMTGQSNHYKIELVKELPDDAFYIRSACINGTHIQFYERVNTEKNSSVVFWKSEF